MIRPLLLLISAAAGLAFAAGRIEIFHAPTGSSEQPVGSVFEMPSAPVGGASSVRFRLRNTGDAAVTLSSLYCVERWCSMTGAPPIPHIMAANTNVDFTIRFSPPDAGSYSATLKVNANTVLLRGSGVPAAVVYASGRAVQPGEAIDFGAVETGQSRQQTLQLRNPSTAEVPLGVVAIAGSSFSFAGGAPAGRIAAGGVLDFAVMFRPSGSGLTRERLIVEGREYLLTGSVNEPAISRPSLQVDVPTAGSAQQGRVSIHLAEPSRARATTGVLRMELQPAGGATDNDGSAAFLSGGRTVQFVINQGDSVVRFAEADTISYQSGTTAGTIVFSVEVGGYRASTSVIIGPERVRLDRSQAQRSGSSIDVRINGFDNTRSIAAMNFTFHLKNGQALTPMQVPVGPDFAKWWSQSKLGGAFAFRAVFPVQGDAAQIAAVEVEIPNQAGTVKTERITF
ncbi:MAG TPA: choice-of-anchor D domain-containing protein [Bryobacteraceae bacterium]|nr:choice-of-anchor D domain-containing protein [Bryobacteraceae bacterium]